MHLAVPENIRTPHRGILGLTLPPSPHPLGNSSFGSCFSLKDLVFQTLLPIGISNNHPWDRALDIFWNQSSHGVFFHVTGASALWALAGVTRHQQQRIASMIGINILVDMLMLKSETLQFIAGRAIIALTTENIENQNKIVAGGGVQPLVRLLRSAKTSEKVCEFIDINLLGKKYKKVLLS